MTTGTRSLLWFQLASASACRRYGFKSPLAFSTNRSGQRVEIQVVARFRRFTLGLFFAGLAAMSARWEVRDGLSDRVLLVASAFAVAILMANIALVIIALVSMGYAIIEPVVMGVLGFGIVAGLIVGGFILHPDTVKPSLPQPGIDKNATLSVPSSDSGSGTVDKPSASFAMQRLDWWWRPPVYLVLQFCVWALIARQSWPIRM